MTRTLWAVILSDGPLACVDEAEADEAIEIFTDMDNHFVTGPYYFPRKDVWPLDELAHARCLLENRRILDELSY